MLPELDVFHAHSHQLVHPERITLHHKDFIFMTPGGQRGALSQQTYKINCQTEV